MFREKEVTAYRSVTAPQGLKARSINDAGLKKKHFTFRPAFAAAGFGAVAAAAFSILFVLQPFAPAIGINGQELNSSRTVAMSDLPAPTMARSISTGRLTFRTELAANSDVSVNRGVFTVTDEEGNIKAEYIQSFSGKGIFYIGWDIVPTDGENCEMQISAPFSKSTVSVYYDAESGNFTLERY